MARRNCNVRRTLIRIYRLLETHYGPTHWWPGETPFEIAVGAVLTQNTAWTNVEKAIANLKSAGLLEPNALLNTSEEHIYEALRPSGYFRVKTQRLRAFCLFLVERFEGSMEKMAQEHLEPLRRKLLRVKGIGEETADDILLYACEKPVFVVDAYTRRLLSRHGLCSPTATYAELQGLFHRYLPLDVPMFKEYHGLIVYTGKDFCRRLPRCEECPLKPLLTSGKPLGTG